MARKPKLSVEEQLQHLKDKGVMFNIYSEDKALEYLSKNNNYFKLRSYRKNYNQKRDGTYVNLEFAYLRDLAIIDMRIRYCLLEMCLDIEHNLRVRIIKAIEQSSEDGYSVVADYRALDPGKFDQSIEQASKSPYCRDLINSYRMDMPVWVFVEVSQFGQLIEFSKFVGKRLCACNMLKEYYYLQEIRQLRNACAHSNCLINDVRPPERSSHQINKDICSALTKIGISPDSRKKKMKNDRIRQITTLLFFYNKYVESKGLIKHQTERLYEAFIRRPNEHRDFYTNNNSIRSTFEFLCKVVDKWYRAAYNTGIEQKP